jgi:large subunit ribosomal protein L14
MIQSGTYLNVIDNSGAKVASCIKVISGYRRRYAHIGDIITISIKSLRSKRRSVSKTKKGEVYKAVVVRTKTVKKSFCGDNLGFLENSAVLLNKQNKFIGTRIFGSVPKSFRYTKFLKIASLSLGLVS